MMSSLFYPLVTFVLLLVCVAYWGTTAMYPLILCVCVCFYAPTDSAPTSTVYSVHVLLNQMCVDIWPRQETPSTECLPTAQQAARVSMALRIAIRR